jgi:putative ABC transport system ATP-binding protein
MSLIRVDNVSKQYRLGDQMVPALHAVTLSIEEGVFLAIAGPSGHTPDELADLRARTIGFIFQTFNLLPVLSAEENVEYPLLQFRELDRKARRERVARFLEVVKLGKFAHHRPSELSGGQRQRVAIARALATQPKIILADEPTANLDSRTGAGILDLMKDINRSFNTTFVFSTHDKKVIAKADRLVRIEDGRIRRLGVRSSDGWVLVKDGRSARHATTGELKEVEK